MNLKLDKLQKTSNLLIEDITTCKNSHELEIMKKQIDQFKQAYLRESKAELDINLVNTYYNLLIELLEYSKMKLKYPLA